MNSSLILLLLSILITAASTITFFVETPSSLDSSGTPLAISAIASALMALVFLLMFLYPRALKKDEETEF